MIIDLFNLPKQSIIQRRVPFKSLNQVLTTAQQTQVSKYIKNIIIYAECDENNTRIHVFKDDTFVYESIQFFLIEPNLFPIPKSIFSILHNIFPNPSIYIVNTDYEFQISIALKRLNLVEQDKTTVTDLFVSEKIKKQLDYPLLDLLNTKTTRAKNLKEYYEMIYIVFYLFENMNQLDKQQNVDRNINEWLSIVRQLQVLKFKEQQYKDQLNQASNTSKKMDIHILMKKNEQELDKLINEIIEKENI